MSFKIKSSAVVETLDIRRAQHRVNLIGEHIDYCGYSVLPMAIEQSIHAAFRHIPESSLLSLRNTASEYGNFELDLTKIVIDKTTFHWSNYFLSGVLGVINMAKERNLNINSGVEVCILGDIPPSAGLSSSSALVCAGAMIMNHIYEVGLVKTELAGLCATSEKFVGTEGGGMDQAIAMMAERGYAKLIEFNPLRTTDVRLPDGAVFMVLNSMIIANKAAFESFNVRVVEGRIGTLVLSQKYGKGSIRKPSDLQKGLGKSLDEMRRLTKEDLHEEPYSKKEVCSILGITEEELEESILTSNTKHIQSFKCKQRLLHVFSEAARVEEFKKTCDNPQQASLATLGKLMNESHASCRDLYECSHPELDKLVNLVAPMAYGVRLTGAGWGGCAVAMIPAEKVEEVQEYVWKNYYQKLEKNFARSQVMFVTSPGPGATLFSLELA
ncbi:N-acetylgalactosamine kinase-like isoform X2 [Artemia franciscana]|uniref:N-acetylgalactosamine kinase-like isoform X2 n=1 Tax=Artemia franciscana TaxID=6661 RepID=UPI0032DAABEE